MPDLTGRSRSASRTCSPCRSSCPSAVSRCRRVRASAARRFCECSGPYVADVTPADFAATVCAPFRSLAEILTAVDGVFPPGSEARTGLDGEVARAWEHVATRRGVPGTVEIWPLVEPYGLHPQDREQASAPESTSIKR